MSEYQFQKIKDSNAYVSLRKDIIIPKNSEIAYNAIFQYTKPELEQTEKSVVQIFTSISNDVVTEIKQGELLDSKLKSTFKRLKYTYKKVLTQRAKHAKYKLKTTNPITSKHLNSLEKTIDKCDDELKDIESMSKNIIENLVAINNNFIEDEKVPILSLDNLSGKQYPTLFRLLKQSHPEVITQRINKVCKNTSNRDTEFVDLNTTSSLTNPYSNTINLSRDSLPTSTTLNIGPDIIFNSNHNATSIGDVNNASSLINSSDVIVSPLIPLFLRKKAISSTVTSLQNINGENVTATDKTKQ